MNINCCKSLSNLKTSESFISIFLLVGLFLLASTPGLAVELSITPYQASYKFYKSGFQIARSSLSLEQSGRFWRWRLSSKPRGVYKLFTDKKPYSETTFSLLDNRYRIHNILLADEGDDELYETARFDWNSRKLDIQRKGKRRILDLPEQVFDFLTLPLLTAQMMEQGARQAKFNFYLKGEVFESKIVEIDKTTLDIDGKKIVASVYHQTIVGQTTNTKYFFGPDNGLLPLKIENINSKGKTSIMILNQVIWL